VRDGVLAPDRATIGTIHQQVLYLADLVEDLRLLTETEADDFRLNREPGSLVETVRESVEGARAKAEASGVVLSVDLPAESPTIVFDRTRVSQVVGNLLDNAVRHTPTGGTVTVSAAVGQSSASVTVADTGEGIPADVLPFVFDRFYRVDPSRSRATGGAGLGLTIARKLVDAHGGSIRVESEAGRGTSFTFDLPLDGGRVEKSET
jgi:two-component system sensor histidine kinase BaeS